MSTSNKLLFIKVMLSIIGVFFSSLTVDAQVQKTKTDSLEKLLIQHQQLDTTKVKLLYQLGYAYWGSNPTRGIELSEKALELAKKLDYKLGMYGAYRGLGSSYFGMSNYTLALESFLNALRIAEELNDPTKISYALGGLGLVYYLQKSYPQALEYFKKSDSVSVQYDGLYGSGRARNQSNMGETYMLMENYDSALTCLERSIEISTQRNEPVLGDTYSIMAGVYTKQKRYDKALKAIDQALVRVKKENNQMNLASVLFRKAKLQLAAKQRKEAYKSVEEGIRVAVQASAKAQQSEGYLLYHDFLLEDKKYKQALEYYHQFKLVNDEMYQEKSSKELERQQQQYEVERKQKEFELNQKRLELQQAQLDRQQYVMLSLSALTFFVLILAIVLFKNNRNKKKTNNALHKQKEQLHEQQQELMAQTEELYQLNEEISTQRDNLSDVNTNLKEYNKRVTDSIAAAQIIQEALLPFSNRVSETFNNHFIIYRPKDIVSGDFYWMTKTKKYTYLAVIDCTGHGVPGAFTSILAYSLLGEAEEMSEDKSPAGILTLLYHKVKRILSYTQRGDKQDIGMDIALCRFEYKNDGNYELVFAGAKRPLHIIKDHKLVSLRGSRLSIGSMKELSETKKFENQTLALTKGDMVYLSTDGYVDAPTLNGKKIGTKKFEELISSSYHLQMDEQKDLLSNILDKNQGNKDQRDDITVVGVKL